MQSNPPPFRFRFSCPRSNALHPAPPAVHTRTAHPQSAQSPDDKPFAENAQDSALQLHKLQTTKTMEPQDPLLHRDRARPPFHRSVASPKEQVPVLTNPLKRFDNTLATPTDRPSHRRANPLFPLLQAIGAERLQPC